MRVIFLLPLTFAYTNASASKKSTTTMPNNNASHPHLRSRQQHRHLQIGEAARQFCGTCNYSENVLCESRAQYLVKINDGMTLEEARFQLLRDDQCTTTTIEGSSSNGGGHNSVIDVGAFCGGCPWQGMNFDCDTRVVFLKDNYNLSNNAAKEALLSKEQCVDPNYVPSKNTAAGDQPPNQNSSESDNNGTGMPVGGIVGIIVALTAILMCIVCCWYQRERHIRQREKRRRQRKKNKRGNWQDFRPNEDEFLGDIEEEGSSAESPDDRGEKIPESAPADSVEGGVGAPAASEKKKKKKSKTKKAYKYSIGFALAKPDPDGTTDFIEEDDYDRSRAAEKPSPDDEVAVAKDDNGNAEETPELKKSPVGSTPEESPANCPEDHSSGGSSPDKEGESSATVEEKKAGDNTANVSADTAPGVDLPDVESGEAKDEDNNKPQEPDDVEENKNNDSQPKNDEVPTVDEVPTEEAPKDVPKKKKRSVRFDVARLEP